MPNDQMLADNLSADQMLLDDPLEDRRIARALPRAFGIHDRDRPPLADAKAVGFRPEDAALLRKSELLQAPLQEIPRGAPTLLLAAFRRRLTAPALHGPAPDPAGSRKDRDRGGRAPGGVTARRPDDERRRQQVVVAAVGARSDHRLVEREALARDVLGRERVAWAERLRNHRPNAGEVE